MPLSGEPLTENFPSRSSMSAGSASSWWATMRLTLAWIFSAERAMDSPPTASDREPYVFRPSGPVEVSPCSTSTMSGVVPTRSATIWAKLVSRPWPCGEVPV